MPPDWLIPDWPAPANVVALMTTRIGGVSQPPYASLNPASHVGDDPAAVAENRRILRQALPGEPLWLNQVHGNRVIELALPASRCPPLEFEGGMDSSPLQVGNSSESPLFQPGAITPEADASFTRLSGQVCAVLTADCLPVLFCDEAGTVVAAAHAGWRGLAGGVLENTVAAMATEPGRILAWLGAAIGPDNFEVGPEVREAFLARHPLAGIAFRPALPGTLDESPRKWLADIYVLARLLLAQVGVERVHGGGLDTFRDARHFHSYRRDGVSGRMASLIWLADSVS